jgi:hypothetical protein
VDGACLTIALLLGCTAACAPLHSHLQPFRDDPWAEAALVRRAASACDRRPPHAFTTDGCSMSPDLDIAECCVSHDIAYWCGGPTGWRREADRRLAECVRARGHSASLAGLVEGAVRVGGASWWPLPWRWGYGWDWPATGSR